MAAFDLTTKAIKWRIQLPKNNGLLNSDLLIDNGVIYTYDSKTVYALNKENGALIWKSPDTTEFSYTLEKDHFVVVDGIIYIWAGNSILGFETITGKPILQKRMTINLSAEIPFVLENGNLIGTYPASSGSKN